MNYYAVTLKDDYISHHGVKGMKWGVRHDPERVGKRKVKVKKKKWKEMSKEERRARIHKIVAITAGVSLAALLTYKIWKERKAAGEEAAGKILEKGTKMNRISAIEGADDIKRTFYSSTTKSDANKYIDILGSSRKNYGGTGKVFQKTLSIKDNMKIAGTDDAKKVFDELMKTDTNFKSAANEAARSARLSNIFMMNPKKQKAFGPVGTDATYDAFNYALVNHNKAYDEAARQPFFDALKKKGYSGVMDVNDRRLNDLKADSPMIIFDTKNIAQESIRELDKHDFAKARAIEIGKRLAAPVLGTTAGIAAINYKKNERKAEFNPKNKNKKKQSLVGG